MKERKISVIIPVYNKERWVENCLRSVLNQTYHNLEVLLINDGSIDRSAQIMEDFIKKDKRIRFFEKQNQGVASARNLGLQNASGDIITFVDADDYLDAGMYQKMIFVMEQEHADIVECAWRTVNESGALQYDFVLQEESIIGKRNCVRHYLRQKNNANYTCNKLYKKHLFKRLSFPALQFSEDYYVNVITHSKAQKKVIIPDRFYNYVQYEDQATCMKHVSLSNLDGVRSGAMVAKYLRHDRELCTYASVYACEYCMEVANSYLAKHPEEWDNFKKSIRKEFLYAYRHICDVSEIDMKISEKKEKYFRFWQKGEISKGIFIDALPELEKSKMTQKKTSRLLKIMSQWLSNQQKNRRIDAYLSNLGYQKIAVYGLGMLGKHLLEELSKTDVSVLYGIDRREVEIGIPVYTMDEILSKTDEGSLADSAKILDMMPVVDCIVVTAVMDFYEIKKQLCRQMECPIFSIEDIINEI